MNTRRQIDEFWQLRRIALVGLSRDPKHFSQSVWKELRGRGYDVVPVNPKTDAIDGQPCFTRVQDIVPPVEGALVMTPPRVTERVVEDCAEAGVTRVWLLGGAGVGASSPKAVAFCESHGMQTVSGHCPFMFLPGTPFFHQVHGFVKKVTGSYPK